MTRGSDHQGDLRRNSPKGVDTAKRMARDRAGSARNRLSPAAREQRSADASRRLLGIPGLAAAGVALVYFALPAEIDPLRAILALRSRGTAIAYPRVESPGMLDVHAVDAEDELVPGIFGLSQPREEAPRTALPLIDVVIIPGVAFDELGRRLGYGGGYYDRLLPRLRPDCLRVGLAFDEQLLAEIPAATHDATVDLIVTPTKVIRPPVPRT